MTRLVEENKGSVSGNKILIIEERVNKTTVEDEYPSWVRDEKRQRLSIWQKISKISN